jgi:hypothetical protein
MQYFIKRNEKINGPFTDVQIKSGISAGKLNDTDMISNSEEGPWMNWGMLSNYASRQQEEGGSVESGDSESAADIVIDIYKDLFKGTARALRKGIQDGIKQHEQRTAAPAFDIDQAVSGEQQPSVPDVTSATDVTSTGDSRTNNCSDCGGLISVQVSTCPHCGAPRSSDKGVSDMYQGLVDLGKEISGALGQGVKRPRVGVRQGVQDGTKKRGQRSAAPGPPSSSVTGSSPTVALKAIAVKEVSDLELHCECNYETAFNAVRLAVINSGGYVHDSVPISGRLSIAFPGKAIPVVVNIQQEERWTSIKVEKVLFVFVWNGLKGKAIIAELKSILSNRSVLGRLVSPDYVTQLTRKERESKNLQAAKKIGSLVGLAVMAPCLVWAIFAFLLFALWLVFAAGALSFLSFL